PDDALDFRGEVRFAVGRRPGGAVGASHTIFVQHGHQCQAGEAHADIGQEGSPVEPVQAGRVRVECVAKHALLPTPKVAFKVIRASNSNHSVPALDFRSLRPSGGWYFAPDTSC